ncbi:regulator of nonsense transcripts UPF3 isoform X1 [Cryptomeria japonica]|uniref:regulator of nonsense transcripts UPF3 isoform X1 n=1 Tax=Cryptomeria japonica TaxID=3369 RepID=UPI0027DA1EE9|nr:regulator of nonsense transcripts UPF3 isoform X1 [Cryptomeria japonica]
MSGGHMKEAGDHSKVVLRHLPPMLSQSALKDQIDARFAGRYNWFYFRPGRTSHRNQQYSRAYVDFTRLEDVIEFAQAFDGHVFVNEKGSHYKAIVEYAPSQRVPKSWSKKDGREGTIFKDIEYLEFLEILAKPVENLPSAEVQLERREAERAGLGAKDNLIITPLMDYVRQKRAAKSGSQRSAASSGKLGRRAGGASAATSSAVGRRGLGKRRTATYVVRDNTRTASNKDKPTYILVPRREDQQHPESDLSVQVVSNTDFVEEDPVRNIATIFEGTTIGGDRSGEAGKRKVLLLKNKDREPMNGHIGETSSPNGTSVGDSPQRRLSTIKSFSSAQQIGGALNQQGVTSPLKGSPGTLSFKQNQRRDASGRITRGILMSKELQESPQLLSTSQTEQQSQLSYTHRDEKVTANGCAVATLAVRQDRRMRNKDRPDRPVWTPRRRADGTMSADESQSCLHSASAQASSDVNVPRRYQANLEGLIQYQQGVASGLPDTVKDDTLQMDNSGSIWSEALEQSQNFEATGAVVHKNIDVVSLSEQCTFQEEKSEMMTASRTGDCKGQGIGRNNFAGENDNCSQAGNYRQAMRRLPASGMKELDSSLSVSDTKSPKRGGILGYGSHEKQVWVAVQKSGSGS